MDSISTLTQCKWCLAHLCDPVFLPCGETVCQKHTQEMRKENSCLLCQGMHKLEEGEQFPINNMALAFLKINISHLDFGPTYNQAKYRVKMVESKRPKLRHMIDRPKDYASAQLQIYKTRVDLAREELKQLVEDVCLEKTKEINLFESKTVKTIQTQVPEITKLDGVVDKKLTNWKESLNRLVVNESFWKEIIEETKPLDEQLDHQLNGGLETPPSILNTSTSIDRRVWIKLSQRLDKKSIWVSDLSLIAKANKWKSVISETFTIQGHRFYLNSSFSFFEQKMYLELYLCPVVDLKETPVKVAWTFEVSGKNSLNIFSRTIEHEFKSKSGWGTPKLMAISDMMAHPAYDSEEDMIRVHVVIKE